MVLLKAHCYFLYLYIFYLWVDLLINSVFTSLSMQIKHSSSFQTNQMTKFKEGVKCIIHLVYCIRTLSSSGFSFPLNNNIELDSHFPV